MAQTLYALSGAAGSVSTAQLDPNVLQFSSVPLSSANILAMNGTPVSILAAPGAGKAIVVDAVLFEFLVGGTQYASGGAVNFQYHGGSATGVFGAVTITAASVNGAASFNQYLQPIGQATGQAITANTGIDITNATGAFTTGTGTAIVKIWYSIVTL